MDLIPDTMCARDDAYVSSPLKIHHVQIEGFRLVSGR